MFTSPENRNMGGMQGMEVKEMNILDLAMDLLKKYELNKKAIEASSLENSFRFVANKSDIESQLRHILPEAITELGHRIQQEESYNQNPSADVAQLSSQKEYYERLLLEIGPEAVQTKPEDILDGSAFDNATHSERMDRQNAAGGVGA